MELVNDNAIYFLIVQGVLFAPFTVYFARTMYHYYYKINQQMRGILISMFAVLAVKMVFDIVVWVIYETNDLAAFESEGQA